MNVDRTTSGVFAPAPRGPLTHDRLVSLLIYEPTTGLFRWKVNNRRAKVGNVAGKVNRAENQGYVLVSLDCRVFRAHRLAWFYVHGEWPTGHLDHINGDRADNHLANLRPASHSENLANQRRRSDNTTGFKGVTYRPDRRNYRAKISRGGRHFHLGAFDTAEEAAAAYMRAARDLYGAFASDGIEPAKAPP